MKPPYGRGEFLRSSRVWAAAGGMLLAIAGCAAPESAVRLQQTRGVGLERDQQLSSTWAACSTAGQDAARLLLEWPLPGSTRGRKQYLLYLQFPRGAGCFEFDTTDRTDRADGADSCGGGFFVQHAGRLRGLTPVTRGTVWIEEPEAMGRPGGGQFLRRGRLYVECADGTQLRGTFAAEVADGKLRAYEAEHRADVQAVLGSPRHVEVSSAQ